MRLAKCASMREPNEALGRNGNVSCGSSILSRNCLCPTLLLGQEVCLVPNYAIKTVMSICPSQYVVDRIFSLYSPYILKWL